MKKHKKAFLLAAIALSLPMSAFSQIFSLWDNHEDAPFGVTIGYVSKQWETDFGRGGDYKENLWGEEDKRLHGVQVGLVYQPCLKMGLGIYTGLFYEAYFSFSNTMDYDQFTEHSCYVPLHASFRLPLAERISVSVHGGLGLNYAFYGEFKDFGHRDYIYDYPSGRWVSDYYGPSGYLEYGRTGWPDRFNASAEIALSVRINSVQIGTTYSRGLTDHGFYKRDGRYKTRQNKFGVSIGFVTEL